MLEINTGFPGCRRTIKKEVRIREKGKGKAIIFKIMFRCVKLKFK